MPCGSMEVLASAAALFRGRPAKTYEYENSPVSVRLCLDLGHMGSSVVRTDIDTQTPARFAPAMG